MADEKTALASVLQELFISEQKAAGFHLPKLCPNYEHGKDEAEDLEDMIHCNHCNGLLLPYAELDNFSRNKLDKKAEIILAELAKIGFCLQRKRGSGE